MAGSLWRQQIAPIRCARRTDACRWRLRPPAGRRTGRQAASSSAATTGKRDSSSGASTSRAGDEQALTANGGVNLEPRISPDGRQIVFVSTGGTRPLQPEDRRPLSRGPRERALPRRAAREQDRPLLLFDARSLHQPVMVAGREARLVRHQHGNSLGHGQDLLSRGRGRRDRLPRQGTSWRRPGPRGRKSGRTASGSCSRTTTAASGTSSGSRRPTMRRRCRSPTASSTAATPAGRPDGKRIAYISNEDGNTALWVQEVIGGARRGEADAPQATASGVRGYVADPDDRRTPGHRISARVSVLGSDGRWHAPRRCVDARRRALRPRAVPERSPLLSLPASRCHVEMPAGKTTIQVQNGFRRKHAHDRARIRGRRGDRAAGPPRGQRPAARTSASSSPPTCTCT